MQYSNTEKKETQSKSHLGLKNFRQKLDNLPVELSGAKRFFPVVITPDGKKLPKIKEWQNPDNQNFVTQIEGLVGFDTCGHSLGADYLFLDFDHVLDNNDNFVNDDAQRWYNFCASMESFCEKSISGHGLHIWAKPTPNKFSPISAGSRGTLHFGNDAKLEIFYKPKARYLKNLRHIVELNFRFRNYAWILEMERKSRREKIFFPQKVGRLPKLKIIFYRFPKLNLT